MTPSRVETFGARLDPSRKASVAKATSTVVERRKLALDSIWGDSLDAARANASAIKAETLDHLESYLDQFKAAATLAGVQIHEAADAAEANRIVLELVRRSCSPGDPIVKAKSMATEEIHLNRHLEAEGFRPVETDLGEFVVQIDGDAPSHIVAPIIHKNRLEVAASFAREGIGPYTEDAEILTKQARRFLREQFRMAKVGISGVNFAIAESGRIVLVENEGNNRLSTTAPDVHIAVMGIEKLIPKDADLALFTRLLGPSSTGQQITTYMHFIAGPRKPDEIDGPREVHLVLLDNGRRKVLGGPYRDILKCIRCGACLNVCPVYRQASGHAYGHVYSGPVGAVLAPAMEGVETMGDLARASTLCGACEEVCPVAIPIPDMLLRLRDEAERHSPEPSAWKWFGAAAIDAKKWRAGLSLLSISGDLPNPALAAWTMHREPPVRQGRDFRGWWRSRRSATKPRMKFAGAPKTETTSPQPLKCVRVDRIEDAVGSFVHSFCSEGGRIATLDEVRALLDQQALVDADAAMCLGMVDRGAEVWDSEVGITLADCLVAETGSILIATAPDRRRMASLAPPIHVVLAKRSQVVASLEEAFARLGRRSAALITGSSRTADIEGILIRGVHGPEEIVLAWLD